LLAQRIVDEGAEILGKGVDYFSVAFEEITPEDWAEKVYKPEIDKNMSKLYKKPGYKM
jgi:4-oxalocrotonate tautomerase